MATIASFGTKRQQDNKETDGDVQPNMSVKDHYYTGKEYSKLSKAKKFGLKVKFQKRGPRMGSMNKVKAKLQPRQLTMHMTGLSRLLQRSLSRTILIKDPAWMLTTMTLTMIPQPPRRFNAKSVRKHKAETHGLDNLHGKETS